MSANIILRLSTGNEVATTNTDPAQALGGAMSRDAGAVISQTSAAMNNLFDNVTALENYNGTTDYRCVFVHNDSSGVSDSLLSPSIYLGENSKASIEIAVGDINALALVIADELDSSGLLANLNFSTPTASEKLPIGAGKLQAGDYVPVWIKRTVSGVQGVGTVADSIEIFVDGVTV